jgi:hypothetical protein
MRVWLLSCLLPLCLGAAPELTLLSPTDFQVIQRHSWTEGLSLIHI